MAEASSVSIAVVARATPLPQTAGATLHWDGRNGVCRAVGPHTLLEHVQPSTFQVKGPPTPAHRARLYWTTGEIGLVPAFPPQAIVWEKAAALLTFALDPLLLADAPYAVLPGATGELVDPQSLPQHHQEYVLVDAPRSVPRGQQCMERFGSVCPPHGTICARFQHFSHACHRWRGTPAL